MITLENFLQQFLSKKLELTLSGKTTSLHVIDWPAIVAKHEEVMEQLEGMDDEAAGEFLCDNETELIQITECFMNDACDEKVEDDLWRPFGLLGLNHDPINYSATKHDGLLLFDFSKGRENNPSIILFKNNKVQTIAESINELDIKTV